MTRIPKQSRIPLLSFGPLTFTILFSFTASALGFPPSFLVAAAAADDFLGFFPTLAVAFLTFDGDDLEVDVDALDDPERGTLDGAIVTNYYKVKCRGKSFGRGRSVFLIFDFTSLP